MADDWFLFVDHGDAFPRAFQFAYNVRRHNISFPFAGEIGDNVTHADMGEIIETSQGFMFVCTSATSNFGPPGQPPYHYELLLVTMDRSLERIDDPIPIAEDIGSNRVTKPKITRIGENRNLVLFERVADRGVWRYSGGVRVYHDRTVYAILVDDFGEIVVPEFRLEGTKGLNAFDTMRYNNATGCLYWVTEGDTAMSYTLYILDPRKHPDLRPFLNITTTSTTERPATGSQTRPADDIAVRLDGRYLAFDVPPQMISGRTMVPLRAIFEALGATVNWNQAAQTVTATRGDVTVSLTIGSNVLLRNGQEIPLDVPAQVVSGRTLVPTRAVAESFGAGVNWDGPARTVVITG
jgi:hypothetical protein